MSIHRDRSNWKAIPAAALRCAPLLLATYFATVASDAIGNEPAESVDVIPTEFFKKVTIHELNASSRSAMTVLSTIPGPGEQCGLRQDDRILAINGYRIYSRWEFDFHRNQLDRERDFQMDLIINRRGHLIPLAVRPVMPIRKLGFYEGDDRRDLDELLSELGITIPVGATASLRRIPVRATYALDDWLASSSKTPHDYRWLDEFIKLRMQLANQKWSKVQPPQHEIPISYFKKLSDFYLSVAARNRDGEKIPDPAAHSVSLAYYVFHYPFPRFAPPLGSFASSDKRFREWVKLCQADTIHNGPPEITDDDDEKLQSPSHIKDYLEKVKLAVVQPSSNGGWPFRYSGQNGGVVNDKARSKFIKTLEDLVALHDRDETLYSFALAALYGLDTNADALIALLKQVREISPYMAYRCVRVANFAWNSKDRTRELNERRNVLLTYLRENPIQTTAKESAFYDFVMPRSRHIIHNQENFVGQPTQSGLIYHPISFASAFGHVDTLDEEAQSLDTAIAGPDFAKHRAELLKRLETLAIPYATPDDMRRLAQLGRDGLGKGLILDSFINIAYGDFMSDKTNTTLLNAITDDVMRQAIWSQPDQYDRGYPYVHKLISELDDDDPEACRDQLLAAHADHGDLAATCLIANTLDKYGYDEVATEMRGKVDRFAYAILSRTRHYGTQFIHSNVEISALCANDQALEQHRDLYVAVREYLDVADIPHEAPAFLLAARYELERDKLTKASNFLIQSFSADDGNRCQPIYLYDGQVTDSHDKFRVWLLRKIAKHKDFDDDTRKLLADSPAPSKLPEVAAELGIAPAPASK